MASTNCVVFSWHHQGRVDCLFLELSASHNIHFLRVTRGGRFAWGSVGTWHAFSTPNGPRLCLRSFSCCLGVRLRDLTFDVDPRDPRRMIDGTGRVLYYKGNLRLEQIELNQPAAENLTEVASLEDSELEAFSAVVDPATNVLKIKAGKALTNLPANAEELRLRHRRIGLCWDFLATRHALRSWLQANITDLFRRFSDYVLGSQVAGLSAGGVSPSWSLVLNFEGEIVPQWSPPPVWPPLHQLTVVVRMFSLTPLADMQELA